MQVKFKNLFESEDKSNRKEHLNSSKSLEDLQIEEINESIKELEEFIETRIKSKNSKVRSSEKNNLMVNSCQNMQHFSAKKVSKDILGEMRENCGKRSQTTRRLIRKIQDKSSKSRENNLEKQGNLTPFNLNDEIFKNTIK